MESELISALTGKRLLLVASTGGHLHQLTMIAAAINPHAESSWLTFDNEQSRSLLRGQEVHYVDYVSPRDFEGVARVAARVRRILRSAHFDAVVSTGAAVALGALPVARISGVRSIYVESVSRFDGPSLSGRVLERMRAAELYSQHRYPGRWKHEFNLVGAFTPESKPSKFVERIFVTLGTIRPYRFDRLVDRLIEIVPPHVKITWQLGETSRSDVGGVVHKQMSAESFEAAVQEADVVITHAGIGTLLQLLDAGASVVTVPRRRDYSEHVDDHQTQASRMLADAGLCVVSEADHLSWGDIVEAAERKATRVKSQD